MNNYNENVYSNIFRLIKKSLSYVLICEILTLLLTYFVLFFNFIDYKIYLAFIAFITIFKIVYLHHYKSMTMFYLYEINNNIHYYD